MSAVVNDSALIQLTITDRTSPVRCHPSTDVGQDGEEENDGGDSDDHDKTIVMLEMMVIMIMISKRFPKIILLLKVLRIIKTPTSCATL